MSNVPPSDQMRVAGSGRRKVALPPGRSQLDWVRNSAKLRPSRPRPVTPEELKQHRSRNDAWMAISGKVFDVTPYVEYHPGGIDKIMLGAGKDGTVLFNKYHPWVNPDFMLARCFIGMLEASKDATEPPFSLSDVASNTKSTNDPQSSSKSDNTNPSTAKS